MVTVHRNFTVLHKKLKSIFSDSIKDNCETVIKDFIQSQAVSTTASKHPRKSKASSSSSVSTCSTNMSNQSRKTLRKRKMSEKEDEPIAKRVSTVKGNKNWLSDSYLIALQSSLSL